MRGEVFCEHGPSLSTSAKVSAGIGCYVAGSREASDSEARAVAGLASRQVVFLQVECARNTPRAVSGSCVLLACALPSNCVTFLSRRASLVADTLAGKKNHT